MDYGFKYTAKTSKGDKVSGVVFAPNQPAAASKLKKAGFQPIVVTQSLLDTLSGLSSSKFNANELARLYTTIGRRLNNGKALGDGLDAASEYISDVRLKQAVLVLQQQVQDGQPEHSAMQLAGFPKRDALVIRATAESGKSGDSFVALGAEVKRNYTLGKAIASTFRLPMLMSVFMVIFIWAAVMFLAPSTMAFLKQTGLRLNFSPMISNYFKFVEVFHQNVWVSSVLYFGVFAAIAMWVKSDSFKSLLDKFSTLKKLSMKSDYAALWNSFTLLYVAGVPPREASAIVADAAIRADSRMAFQKMGKLIESGRSVEDAVSYSGFPHFVVSGVKSAASGGDMAAGLTDLVSNLMDDTQTLTEVLQENAKLGSVIFMALGILLVFVFTYYPMLASVMGNV